MFGGDIEREVKGNPKRIEKSKKDRGERMFAIQKKRARNHAGNTFIIYHAVRSSRVITKKTDPSRDVTRIFIQYEIAV